MKTPLTDSVAQATSVLMNAADAMDAPIGPGEFCDRCVGRAVARATLDGTPLRFCGHHLRSHRPALEANPRVFLHVEEVVDVKA